MAIDFAKTFGANSGNLASNNNQQAQKPKAQFWINVGYLTGVKDDNGDERFVSLGTGIPLDTIETLPTNSKNLVFAQFQAARNDLRDQLIEAAKEMKPGQAEYIGEGALVIQIRRVSEDSVVAVDSSNPFSKKLFGATPAEAAVN